ncbi:MAG: T9SS type A sorting domain-containing protein [Psychroserpens sp.]|uniref:T9SS type A sorting domain-containing protein n=1 Tax=Psychroserpens sp. TaxID=2020870 RepID=UPI00300174A8
MKKTTFLTLPKIIKTSILFVCLMLATSSLFAESFQSDPESGDLTMKIGLTFDSANSYLRKIDVIADENATLGYDSDYDVALESVQEDDMYWLINQNRFLNQGINEFNDSTILPIGINTNSNGIHVISIDKLENIPTDMNIYVHDKSIGIFHNIKEGAYQVNLNVGTFTNRFEITFKAQETLSTNEFDARDKSIDISFDIAADQIKVLNNLNSKIEAIHVYSILGQTVYKNNNTTTNSEIRINANTMTTGAYIVIIKADTGISTKKILVN